MNLAFKLMNFVFKMMNFVFKMMNLMQNTAMMSSGKVAFGGSDAVAICIKNDEFCITDDEFCIMTDDLNAKIQEIDEVRTALKGVCAELSELIVSNST